jgi:hypothetical protein
MDARVRPLFPLLPPSLSFALETNDLVALHLIPILCGPLTDLRRTISTHTANPSSTPTRSASPPSPTPPSSINSPRISSPTSTASIILATGYSNAGAAWRSCTAGQKVSGRMSAS